MPPALFPLLLCLLAPPQAGHQAVSLLQIIYPDVPYVAQARIELGGVRLASGPQPNTYRFASDTVFPQRLVIRRKGHAKVVFERFSGPLTVQLLPKDQPFYLVTNMPIGLSKVPARFAVAAAANDPTAAEIQASLRAVLGREVPISRVLACPSKFNEGSSPSYWAFDLPDPVEQAKLCAGLLDSPLRFGALVDEKYGRWILNQRVYLRLMPGTTRAHVDALLTRHLLKLMTAWPPVGDPAEVEVASRRACGQAPAVALAKALSAEPQVSHASNVRFIFECNL